MKEKKTLWLVVHTHWEGAVFKTRDEYLEDGFRIILGDANVKTILVNIFGGIVRCDRVANGIVAAVKDLALDVPVVVRLAGTNAEEAKAILAESGVDIVPASSLDEAAGKAVALAS